MLALLGVAVLAVYVTESLSAEFLVLPLILVALNLVAALIVQPAFRARKWLVAFHLALLGVILFAGIGRLVEFRGHVEVTTGRAFAPDEVVGDRVGVLHVDRLHEVQFVNQGFLVSYSPGVRRSKTRNVVSYSDESGGGQTAEIGDDEPLKIAGYRFYTSFNKGFAPLLRWRPTGADGEAILGSVHFPSFPAQEFAQYMEWTPPGQSAPLWIGLHPLAPIFDENKPFVLPVAFPHKLVVRFGEQRWELAPGESVVTPLGGLEYVEMRAWMGYTIYSDWALPWMLASALLAVLLLAVHFWFRFSRRSWLDEVVRT